MKKITITILLSLVLFALAAGYSLYELNRRIALTAFLKKFRNG